MGGNVTVTYETLSSLRVSMKQGNLPEPAQGMVRAAIATNNGNTIEFGVDVSIEPDNDPRNARGYKFTCATVFENVDEGLARLEKSLPKLPMIGKD